MIYVDDVGIPAKIWNKRTGRYVESRWYHLISDQIDTTELHEFATSRLGLHRSYFQEGSDLSGQKRDPGHDHYDLTEGKRKQALKFGAVPISAEQLAEITMAKSEAYRGEQEFKQHRPSPADEYGTRCLDCGWVLTNARGEPGTAVNKSCVGKGPMGI